MATSCSSASTSRVYAKVAAFLLAGACAASVRANIEQKQWIFHSGSSDVAFPRAETSARGSPMIELAEIARKFNLKLTFDAQEFEIKLEHPQNRHSLKLKTYATEIEGSFWKARLSKSVEFEGAKALVPIDFGDRALRPLLTGIAPTPATTGKLPAQVDVVVDPGHGGNDYGTTYKAAGMNVHEKDVVLQLGRELVAALKTAGISAALSRETDAFVTLPERTRLANQLRAKIFLSIHLNADPTPKSKAEGFEIFVLSLSGDEAGGRATIARENQMIPEDSTGGAEKALADLRATANLEASLAAAKIFRARLGETLKEAKKSLQMGPFYVLYGADMPALLLELGYLSSDKDRALILDETKRKGVVDSLTSALAEQLKKGINKP